jgi:hypothetical protein
MELPEPQETGKSSYFFSRVNFLFVHLSKALTSKSSKVLEAVLYRGELPRGEIALILHTEVRQAQRIVAELVKAGVLASVGRHEGAAANRVSCDVGSRMDARFVPGETNDLSGETGVRSERSAFAANKARQSLVFANVRNRKMLAVHHNVNPRF